MPVVLEESNLSFTSQIVLKEFIRKMWERCYDKPILPEDLVILKDMWRRHPAFHSWFPSEIRPCFVNYTGSRMDKAWEYKNPEGTWTAFSMVKCVKGRDHTDVFKRSAIMRMLIQPQIEEFRKDPSNKTCKNGCPSDYVEIDHAYPFKDMVEAFMSERTWPDIDTSSLVSTFNDEAFNKAWISDHAENCFLRALCSKCHAKKSLHDRSKNLSK